MRGGVGAGGGEDALAALWLDKDEPPSCHELLDSLLAPPPLTELKPLPPFTGYTGHLQINGISGHHYHAIAQRLPEQNNNFPTQSGYREHDVVSSSCDLPAPEQEPPDLRDVKPFLQEPDSAASCSPPAKLFDAPKHDYDISSIDDIAAIISSALADSTAPAPDAPAGRERADSRDSWMDIDELISTPGDKLEAQELREFGLAPSPPGLDFSCKQEFARSQEFLQRSFGPGAGSTLQTLLTHGYMPLLQNRLTHGPVKQEASSTSYAEGAGQSPPGNAVSTTDGRFAHYSLGLKADACERLLYPLAHTTTPGARSKRSRAKPKPGPSLAFPAPELGALLGKEKPVHRCGICNRGFLNKSNIKVHLRTHTGEKPFRCDVCAKAFRQKAHLLKHQQIHKRIGRD